MKHLGDITLIKGNEAPVVDCIIGGSPCQDLSVAGKRAGLAGERSGLFMEQIRIIKEMRESDVLRGRTDVDVRPRYAVWENVPGALSSPGKGHTGEDFAAVLEEFVRVAEPEAPSVSVPEKGWPTSGCLFDEMGKWSVAWRVLDSQFWGVPQRRRRICLVCDFSGLNAPKIVFGEAEHNGSTEQGGRNPSIGHSGGIARSSLQSLAKGLSGNPEPSEPKRKETAGDAGECVGGAVPYTLKIRGGCSGGVKGALIQEDKSATLSTLQDQTLFQPVISLQGSMIGRADKNGPQGDGVNENVSFTLNTTDRHAVVYGLGSYYSNAMKSNNPHSGVYEAETSKTLDALTCGYPGCNQGGMAVVEKYVFENHSQDARYKGPLEVSPNLSAQLGTGGNNTHLVMEPTKDAVLGNGNSVVGTLMANAGTKLWLGNQEAFSGAYHIIERRMGVHHIVRRLTPLECERLQGFPDGWTDIGEWVDSKGKKHKEADSPRYKALGNSIAIPPWKWVLKRLCACYERDATMASLFDGIGGFPYIWEQINGKGSCIWASEIEEFPMAVTKLRFGE